MNPFRAPVLNEDELRRIREEATQGALADLRGGASRLGVAAPDALQARPETPAIDAGEFEVPRQNEDASPFRPPSVDAPRESALGLQSPPASHPLVAPRPNLSPAEPRPSPPAQAATSTPELPPDEFIRDDDPAVTSAVGARREQEAFAPPTITPDILAEKAYAARLRPSAKEESSLAEARDRDERLDRRSRIFRGIGRALGMVGLAAGTPALAGVGLALDAGGRAVRAPNNAERVQGDIDRRQATENGIEQYMQARAQRVSEAQRQQSTDARQARLDDASIGLTQARTAAATADAEQTQFERALAEGDQAGAREMYRAMVMGLNDESGFVQEQRRLVNSPEFAGTSAATLREGMARLSQLANNRRAGLLESGGSRGGGGPRMVQDPLTLQMHQVARGGGRSRSEASAAPGLPAPAAGIEGARFVPAGRPSASPARPRPRPSGDDPAAANEPSPTPPASSPAIDERVRAIAEIYPQLSTQERTIALAAAVRHGFTPQQMRTEGRAQTAVNAAVDAYRGGTAATQERALSQAGNVLAQDVTRRGYPPSVTDHRAAGNALTAMGQVVDEMVLPYQTARTEMAAARRAGMTAADWQAIVRGNGALSEGFRQYRNLSRLRQSVQTVRENYGRSRSGAAISPQEWDNFNAILGTGNSWMASPDDFESAMTRLVNGGMAIYRSAAASRAGANDAADLMAYHRHQMASARRARRGVR